jgi:hypothetical protein
MRRSPRPAPRLPAAVPAALIVVLSLALAAACPAATWRVETDGSGDFTDLQAAADAAAAGDTLLVGAGRFAALQARATPGGTFEAVLAVAVDDLTVIGAGRDQTFIGPAAWYGPVGEYPKGVTATGDLAMHLRGVTVENLPHAVWWYGGAVDLRDCRVRGGGFGFFGLHTDGAGGSVADCAFETTEEDGFAVWLEGAPSFTVSGSTFTGPGCGVTVTAGSTGVAVAGCEVAGAFGGILFEGSSGQVDDCLVTGAVVKALGALGGSQLVVDHVFVNGGDVGVHVGSGSTLTGTALVVEQTLNAAVTVDGGSVVTLHGSHVLPASGRAVSCFGYSGALATLDFTDNWWGVTEPTAIEGLVWDVNDDPDVHCLIDYDPSAGAPMGTAAVNWGDLKASFR